jgi:hypothetical protein
MKLKCLLSADEPRLRMQCVDFYAHHTRGDNAGI